MFWPDFTDPSVWISLLTLSFLEIVLGVDNIIFISIVANKLPPAQQPKARTAGLLLAMLFRILLLLAITWIIKLTEPVFTIPYTEENNAPIGISWKDIILIIGGIFLIAKSTLEIHNKLERATIHKNKIAYATMGAVLLQIVMVDAVFSFDSILTAVGLVDNIIVMIIAVIVSMAVMLLFAKVITIFVNRNPTIQMLALAFLIVIGILLVAQGFHQKISKSYVYTAMAFSLAVELLNMRLRKNIEKVQLNNGPLQEE
jgi:predicted tellurium resistance membrane protein TerC